VLANAGVDVFEEAFKLIFAKLYDELESGEDKEKIDAWFEDNENKTIEDFIIANGNKIKKFRNLEFRNTGVEKDTLKQISKLFEEAKEK
jgi:type I restriction enzyme M protein